MCFAQVQECDSVVKNPPAIAGDTGLVQKQYGKVSEYFSVPTLMDKPWHQAACYYGETMWDLRCQADLSSSCGSVTS